MPTTLVDPVPARVAYDTANAIYGADLNTSDVIIQPSALQFEALAAGTSIDIQARIDEAASWVSYQTIDSTNSPALVLFTTPIDYIRLVRTGAGDAKVFAQGR